ncbi:MAG: aminotransferase class V-fold PLP-dependent enzyme [Rhodobacteraceae bacterium]|nr:aminotransferase class V-fold PLP-dependent enzyme [Paracoccaceae bacterium]
MSRKPPVLADILGDVRARFAHVDTCPIQGKRIFFENAGGALTLKTAAETSAYYAAIPDNQGRDNPASQALMQVIAQGRADAMDFLGAHDGQIIVGESGTELLFRLIRAACLGAKEGGQVISSSLEHPASRSAASSWAAHSGREHAVIAHDNATGNVTADAYGAHLTPLTRVVTIIHTSPVTGMAVDVAAIVALIRATAPDCLIIIDGIQHAAHGAVDIEALGGVDGYVVSPYKMFSRHGYGLAWLSPRLLAMPHDLLAGGPADGWELGTRDTGAYATFSEVVNYLDWLGGAVSPEAPGRRARLAAAGSAIHAHEKTLTDAMLHGTGNLPGLADMNGVTILGGIDNPAREGLVSLTLADKTAPEVVAALAARGVTTHSRKADQYSGSVLEPLGLDGCTRISLCHYNSEAEIAALLTAMQEITEGNQ